MALLVQKFGGEKKIVKIRILLYHYSYSLKSVHFLGNILGNLSIFICPPTIKRFLGA